MTQEEFARRFRFSVNTLRHWEQGKGQPEGPARAYLLIIDRAPGAYGHGWGEKETVTVIARNCQLPVFLLTTPQ